MIPIKRFYFSEKGKRQWILRKVIRSNKGISKEARKAKKGLSEEKREVEDGRGCQNSSPGSDSKQELFS